MTSENGFTQKVSFPRLYKSSETFASQQSTISFNVGPNYKLLETIGTGAYGVVCSAIDEKTGKHVAIKKIVNAFDVLTTAKRTLRELKLLLHFKHDNVVGIKNIIQNDTDKNTAKDVYFVMDLLRTDLHHLIRSEQPLTAEHVRYFSYQILRGLKYIHSAGVVHRDLKPSNLLINENCDLKIGDFGMARGISMQPEQSKHFMTEYVTTRWYRAPELMLSVGQYNQAIDIWSVGCIFAEMIGRKQLFPGKDYVQQLQLIISVLGSPKKELVDAIRSERVRNYVTSLPHKSPTPLQVLYPKASEVMLSFLHSFLQFDPSERPPAETALSHPFFDTYHNINDEPVCSQPFDFCFESKVTCQEVKEQVMTIINNYHQRKARFLKQLILVRKPSSTSTSQVILKDKTTSKFVIESTTEASGNTTNKIRVGKVSGDQLIQVRPPASEKNVSNTFKVPTTNDSSTVKPTTTSKSTSDDDKPLMKNSAENNTNNAKIDLTNDDETDGEKTPSQPMITVQVDFFPSQFPEAASAKKPSENNNKTSRVTKSTKSRSSASSGTTGADKNISSSNSATRKSGENPKITISEETKMKIRDVIFASMLAKQKGLGKPLDKIRKPVTAADRQKEREEKRRKRQEKLQEKEKRRKKLELKNGEGSKPQLSNEDKDLLERWTKMQQTETHNQQAQNNDNKATEVTNDTRNNNQTLDSAMKTQKVVVKQPVVLVVNNKERQHINKEKEKSSTNVISKSTFPAQSHPSISTTSHVKTSQSSAPCRPASLFNLPLQTSRLSTPSSSGQHQLTPGTLLEISGGNTNKNLTTLSPDTIESVFASDALLSNMKDKPKVSKSFELTNTPAVERRNHQITTASKVSALNKNVDLLPFPTLTQPSKSMVLPNYHAHTTTTTTCSDFSPSDYLRSPHFSTGQKPELNLTDCNPLLPHLSSPAQMVTSSVSNAASGYGLGACMDVEALTAATQTLNHAMYSHTDAGHQPQQRRSEGSGDTSQLGSDDLLADWLEMNNYLQPLEMEALQRELELGSPMSVDDFL